jgi:hypothetical protein
MVCITTPPGVIGWLGSGSRVRVWNDPNQYRVLFWRQSNNSSSSTGLPDAAPQDSYSIQDIVSV